MVKDRNIGRHAGLIGAALMRAAPSVPFLSLGMTSE
jgi:hypothetical protein